MATITRFTVLALTFANAAMAIDLEAMDYLLDDDCGVCDDGFCLAQTTNWCDKAQSPEDPGWFKKDEYQAKTASEKMTDLWGMIEADTSVQPYYWKEYT